MPRKPQYRKPRPARPGAPPGEERRHLFHRAAVEHRSKPRADALVDRTGLDAAWSRMQDTHEFFGLLKTYEVERRQSFRLMEGRHTERRGLGAVEGLDMDDVRAKVAAAQG